MDKIEGWLDEDFGERWRSLLEEEEEREPDPASVEPFPSREERAGPVELKVVEKDLPPGLFGFTRRGSDHVVVNRNLYRVDREKTVEHEKTHHRHPKDELTIRYINGDLDVENTLSFQAGNVSRLGTGSAGVPGTAAAYSAYRQRHPPGQFYTENQYI
ncbi:MAG: hypothetical protein ABEI07_00295 [Candidatus Nanohaloarchaea archaeon]